MRDNPGEKRPGLRIPWWLIILLVLFAARLWNNYSREVAGSSKQEVTPVPVSSGAFTAQTSVQDGEIEASNACQKAIDVSNGSETIAHFRAHAGETVNVCTTAYEDELKDAAQDSGDAHYLDENNAATVEEMVSAALGLEGDKVGSQNASDKAVTLARDVEVNSNNPKLVAAAKETIRELIAPITASDKRKYMGGIAATSKSSSQDAIDLSCGTDEAAAKRIVGALSAAKESLSDGHFAVAMDQAEAVEKAAEACITAGKNAQLYHYMHAVAAMIEGQARSASGDAQGLQTIKDATAEAQAIADDSNANADLRNMATTLVSAARIELNEIESAKPGQVIKPPPWPTP